MVTHPHIPHKQLPTPYQQGEGMHAVCDTNTAPIALIASHFDNDGMLRTRGVRLSTPALPRPLAAIWWAAGFSFSRGRLVEEVPYLNNVPGLFFGEEPAMLLRYWQAGWYVGLPRLPVGCLSRCTIVQYHPYSHQGCVLSNAHGRVSSMVPFNAPHPCNGAVLG